MAGKGEVRGLSSIQAIQIIELMIGRMILVSYSFATFATIDSLWRVVSAWTTHSGHHKWAAKNLHSLDSDIQFLQLLRSVVPNDWDLLVQVRQQSTTGNWWTSVRISNLSAWAASHTLKRMAHQRQKCKSRWLTIPIYFNLILRLELTLSCHTPILLGLSCGTSQSWFVCKRYSKTAEKHILHVQDVLTLFA